MNTKFLSLLALVAFSPTVQCQQTDFFAPAGETRPDAIDSESASKAAVGTVASPVPAKDPLPLTHRWLDLKTLSHTERYRNAYNQGGYHFFEDGQQRSLIEGRVKLDAEGRYAIGFRASSGRYFNWAFADYAGEGISARVANGQARPSFTPLYQAEIKAARFADPNGANTFNETASNGWQFYMRELYFSATPVDAVTVQFGSFGFERGYGTEITTFDDDGYLSGERVQLQAPKKVFFDQIGFTTAYFGDVDTVNLFDRGASYGLVNYRQFYLKKRLNARVGFSSDATWQAGTHTLREAALVGTQESKLVDEVRVEVYERLNTVTYQGLAIGGGAGFAVTAEKRFHKLAGDAGFAMIDGDYTVYSGSRYPHAVGFSLNGDTYGQGNRPFVHASYKIAPGVTAFGFYTHALGNTIRTFNQQGLNAGLNFDLKAWANVEKKVF